MMLDSLLVVLIVLIKMVFQISFVSMYLTFQFSKVIQCTSDFSDLAGYTSRLGQLIETLDEINTEMENIAIDFPHEESFSNDTSVHLDNVSIHTPNGDLVVSGTLDLLFCILLLRHITILGLMIVV